MKRIFSSFVATFSLLAFFISSAACVALPYPQVATAMEAAMSAVTVSAPVHECCPSHAPMQQHSTISCCTVHHQPAAASAVHELDPSLQITHADLPAALLAGAATDPPSRTKTGPPPRRPAPALRI